MDKRNFPYEYSILKEPKWLSSLSAITKFNNDYQSFIEKLNTSPALVALESAVNSARPNDAVYSVVADVGKTFSITNSQTLEIAANLSQLSMGLRSAIETYSPTPAWEQLQRSIIKGSIAAGLQDFSHVINAPVVGSQDLALLKLNSAMRTALRGSFDRGITSIINCMHVGTAKKLAKREAFSFSKKDRSFFVEDEPSSSATVQEMNVVCAGTDILHEISETELVNFMTVLAQFGSFAAQDPTGKKIYELISNWKPVIDFDRELYYHGRAFGKDEPPYPNDEMCKAPAGMTSFGRFNSIGVSHYYFSDSPLGAIREVEKHASKPYRIQVAHIKPVQSVKLIDLSGENKGNKFLDYCRFPVSSGSQEKRIRAYLIPSYVGQCCQLLGVDGIKYYGKKEYSNYVTWKDGHFSFVSNEICDVE